MNHEKLPPIEYPSLGIYKCCSVLPECRVGLGISSMTCPKCGGTYGAWILNAQYAFDLWNHSNYFSSSTFPKPKFDRTKEETKTKEEVQRGIDGFEDGWRYIPFIKFYGDSFRDGVEIENVIVRYDVRTHAFTFYKDKQTITFFYNTPKRSGAVSYGIEGSCFIDSSHASAELHNMISLHSYNRKWDQFLLSQLWQIKKLGYRIHANEHVSQALYYMDEALLHNAY